MNSIDITEQDVETAAAYRNQAWQEWLGVDPDEDDTAAREKHQRATTHYRIQEALYNLQSQQAKEEAQIAKLPPGQHLMIRVMQRLEDGK